MPGEFYSILDGRPPLYHPYSTETFGLLELENGSPAGIAVASSIPEHSNSLIHFIYSRHIEELLEKMEALLSAAGKRLIKLNYREENPFAEEIAAVCKKKYWEGPLIYSVRYLIEIQRLHPSWLEKEYSFGKDFTPFPWVTLSPAEEKRLMFEEEQGRITHAASPFNWQDPLETLNSLGLAYKGKTVGWMVNHRISEDTIRYSVLYTYPELRNKGEIIKLLIRSIKEQQKSSVPYALFDVNYFGVDLNWRRFIARRLAPYAKKISKESICWKQSY